MLLAREALDIKYTEQAEDALRQSLIESRVRATLTGHEEALRDLDFSPDGDRLVTGSDDYSARIWDVDTAETVAVLSGHQQPVHDVEYSSDGSLIATLAQDYTARLWDGETGERVAVLRDQADPRLLDIEFSPYGGLLVTTSFGNQAKLWDTATGELVYKLPGKTVDRATFSPNGQVLLTASQASPPTVWDIGTGRKLAEYPAGFVASAYSDAEYSPGGEFIALANRGFERGVNVSLLRSTGELVAGLRHGNSVNDLAFDPRGRLLATGSDNSTARVWRVSDGKPLATMSGHTDPVNSVSFSDNGKLLVTGSDDGTARVWDARTGRAVAELRGHAGAVARAEFSPDGQSVATAGRTDLVGFRDGRRLQGARSRPGRVGRVERERDLRHQNAWRNDRGGGRRHRGGGGFHSPESARRLARSGQRSGHVGGDRARLQPPRPRPDDPGLYRRQRRSTDRARYAAGTPGGRLQPRREPDRRIWSRGLPVCVEYGGRTVGD
jgi:dipeptidyl aminopeptidase/acylaminoacyl peptidase